MGFMRNIAPFMGLSGGAGGTTYLIDPAKTTFYIDNVGNSSDSTSVDVTPDTMSTTSTKVDTGDGTSFFRITSGATATGDFTLEIILFGTPPTSNKSAKVRISDTGGNANSVDVNVNYTYVQ